MKESQAPLKNLAIRPYLLYKYRTVLVLYDGDCGFCGAVVARAKRYSSDIKFEPLDSESGLIWKAKAGNIDSLIVVVNDRFFVLSDAVIELLLELPGHKVWGFLLRLIPKPLRDWGYRTVAKNRHCDFF